MRGYDDNDMHWDGGVWLGMSLMMTIFLLALAVMVYFAARWIRDTGQPADRTTTRSTGPSGAQQSEAEQALALRFARGEIDAEEFHQRSEMLRVHRSG